MEKWKRGGKVEIEYKNIDDIIPYENNPRHNDEAAEYVAKSIKEFGFKNPIIIDKNNVIVAGHTRLKAAKKLGLKNVPCIRADDLTEDQIKAFRLADNKVSELATWDVEKLNIELQEINLNMLDFGFDDLEMDDITIDDEKEIIEDEIPEVPTNPTAKYGDIYQLGKHRLMCGDSTKEDDINKLMNGKKADLVFTDPPYQLETQGGGIFKSSNRMKQIKQNGVDIFSPSKLTLWGETNIFFHNKPLIKSYIELAENNKMPYDLAFYKKENTVPNYKGHLMTDVEYIAIIGNQDPNKGFEKELYSKCFIGKKDIDNELSYSKPVALCAKFVRLYAKKLVLDMFGGSGSTLIACEQLGRACYVMELNPKYIDVIIKRWENLTGQKAVKL